MLSNSFPSISVPRYLHDTISVFVGFGPVPWVTILYCNPLGSATTPGLVLFAVRNASPAFWLVSASSFCLACIFAIICVRKSVIAAFA